MALNALLARIGTSQPVEPLPTLAALAEGFDFAHFGRAPAHFDVADVETLNAKLLHHLDYAEVADRLPAGATEDDWTLLRGNISRLEEIADWLPVLSGAIEPVLLELEDRQFIAIAASEAAGMDWTVDPWGSLTQALKDRTGRKGRALFHPLRKALTGRDSGPEMAMLLRRLGRDRALSRLRAAAAL
jgi:glutamyl-tRNA synthetase